MQPGGRPPAPGELALVQAFINSHYDLELDHGADLLADPASCARWLGARDLLGAHEEVSRPELVQARALREALRALARDRAMRQPLDYTAPLKLSLTPHGLRFARVPDTGVTGALGVIVAIVGRAMIEGTWSRLKVCPGHDCGWAFYDNSRNLSGRWCSMAVCGGRAKARAHYQRLRA